MMQEDMLGEEFENNEAGNNRAQMGGNGGVRQPDQ